jgi:predicted transposase YdaD
MLASSYGEGKAEGIAEGEAAGEQKQKLALVKRMLADQEPIEKIIKWTGLSREEIESLDCP